MRPVTPGLETPGTAGPQKCLLGGDSSAPVAMARNWSVGRHYLGDRGPATDLELHQKPSATPSGGLLHFSGQVGTRRALHRYDAD